MIFALKTVRCQEDKHRRGTYSDFNFTTANMIPNQGKWSKTISPRLCMRGWHVVLLGQVKRVGRVNNYLLNGNEMWIVAIRGKELVDWDKAAYGQIKFVTKLTQSDISFTWSHPTWRNNPDKLLAMYDRKIELIKKNYKRYGLTSLDMKSLDAEISGARE